MTRTLTPSDARQVLSDLLQSLGEDADAVLTEVLADRDVRSLRVVGPLVMDPAGGMGARSSLHGILAHVSHRPRENRWRWWFSLQVGVEGGPREGFGATRSAVDRALCLALRGLGWAPVEVPSEEDAAGPAPSEPPPPPEARTMEDIPPGINAQLEADRNGGALSEAWAEAIRTAPPGSRAWRQEFQQQPWPSGSERDAERQREWEALHRRYGREAHRIWDEWITPDEDTPPGAHTITLSGRRYHVFELDGPEVPRTWTHRVPLVLPEARLGDPLPELSECRCAITSISMESRGRSWIRISYPCEHGVVVVERGRTVAEVCAALDLWRVQEREPFAVPMGWS